jgi:hypothetical protein
MGPIKTDWLTDHRLQNNLNLDLEVGGVSDETVYMVMGPARLNQ